MQRTENAHHKAEFKRRLESFSDIVFGLSLSQLALLFGVPPKASDLVDHPLRYVIFFASFAIICSFWYSHHRMFRYFSPGAADVLLNFTYLAFTVLVPFSMQAVLQFPNSPYALGLYIACFIGTSGTMCALVLRSLYRSGATLGDAERLDLFRRAVRVAGVCLVMFLALALLPLGVAYAGSVLWVLFPLMAVVRLLRAVPPAFVRPNAPA